MTKTILIADDSLISRRMIKRAFPETADFRFLEAGDGEAVLETLAQEDVDFMILDLTMPKLEGLPLLNRLKAMGSIPPFVVISADIQPQVMANVQQLGAQSFVEKPITSEKVASMLKTCGLL
ncbi:MAG: response regulator [Gammaproteobacteria bacterium]|nr:response regulator [Gammaproteobacteria bacterium]